MGILKSIADYFSNNLGQVGMLAIGAGVLWRLMSKDGRQEKSEIVSSALQMQEFWKKQAQEEKLARETKEVEWKQVMDAKEKAWNGKYGAMQKEIGQINGRMAEKDRQNKEYRDLLTNQNPATEKFYADMVAGMQSISEFMSKINDHMQKEIKIESTIHA